MKLPRDLAASQLIKALRVLRYSVDHQRGSHIRIVTQLNGEHHETIPNHNSIKVGKLAHSSEHRQTSQRQCRRSAIAIGLVTRPGDDEMNLRPNLRARRSSEMEDGRERSVAQPAARSRILGR